MRKRYSLSVAVAVVLISVVVLSSVALASYPSTVKLDIKAIAADDQIRGIGVMVLGLPKPTGWVYSYEPGFDLFASYDIVVTLAGLPVTPSMVFCQLIMLNPVNPPNAAKQFPGETIKTVPIDESVNFVCKARWLNSGVGALDVYYVGPVAATEIGDYMLVIQAIMSVGKVNIWGTDTQKLCLLGFSMGIAVLQITLPDGSLRYTWNDALGGINCQDAAWAQRIAFGVPIPTS
jgi:hypothetical protein